MALDVKIWEVYMVNHHNKKRRRLQGTAQTFTGSSPLSTQASLSVEPEKEFKQLRGKKSGGIIYWNIGNIYLLLLEVLFILSSHKSLTPSVKCD